MGNIINADILRQVRGPDIGRTFNSILTNVRGIDQIRQGREQANQTRAEQGLKSIAIFGAQVSPMLEQGDIEGARASTIRRITQLERERKPTDESRKFLELLDTNPELAKQRAGQAVQLGQKLGFFSGQQRISPSQKGQARIVNRDGNLFSVQEIFDPNSGQIQVVETPIKGDLVQRSTGRTTEQSLDFVGDVEEAKFKKKLKFAPEIARDIAKAKQEVQQRGGVFSELNQAEAALPGLENVVSKLKVLSGEATFTLAGRVFDTAAKELFGVATKGATAREKMISLVSNQVLPLLKPIFGSQFTEREGDRLIAAFADVDSTPEARREQLDSFLDQMKRNIEAKRGELQGIDADNTQQQLQQFQEGQTATNAQGQSIIFQGGQWVVNNG